MTKLNETNKGALEILEGLEANAKTMAERYIYTSIVAELGYPSDSDTSTVNVDLEVLIRMLKDAWKKGRDCERGDYKIYDPKNQKQGATNYRDETVSFESLIS